MKCRKCGTEILDNSLRCKNCGIKVNMVCPGCNKLVPFGSKKCPHCDFELIKICSNCKASNVYSADVCRKCGQSFTVEPKEDIEKIILEEDFENPTEELEQYNDIELVGSFSSTEVSCPELKNAKIESDIEKNAKKELRETIPIQEDDDSLTMAYAVKEKNEDKTQIEKAVKEIPLDDVVNYEGEKIAAVESLDKVVQVERNAEQDLLLLDKTIQIEPIEEVENGKSDINVSDESQIQEVALNNVLHLVKTSISKHVIAINGPEGSGKTALLKKAEQSLFEEGYLFLYGSCTPLLQITTFGFFQDAFLRLMGFPPFTKSVDAFVKGFKNSELAAHFSFLSDQEIDSFLNIFYPYNEDKFENILNNKEKIFELLEKVLKSFSLNQNLVLAIDNFDLLDGASYDFIVYLLNKGYFTNRLKLLVAYQENKAIQTYFDTVNFEDEIFEMITLKELSDDEVLDSIKTSLNIDIKELFSEDYIKKLLKKVNGNALRAEQEIALLFDVGYISIQDREIIINDDKKLVADVQTFEELVKLRLNSLTPAAKNVLFMAAIMGYRFSNNILCVSVAMPDDKAEQLLKYLCQEMYISPVDDYTCEFKSLALWKLIYQEATKDILYKENTQKLYQTLKPLILSSNLQKLISCREALSQTEAFEIWQNTARLSAKFGDTNLYVISQKQCLKLLDEYQIEDADAVRAGIYEQLGKVLCEKSPTEALTYLSTVLNEEIKVNNLSKVIDLSGYFIKSCYLSCNYFGAAEAVDSILSCINNSKMVISDLDIALIKARKLKALINIGNSEQIIYLVKHEILPVVSKSLYSEQIDGQYKTLLIDTWLNAKTTLVKAYAIQGNKNVFEEINSMKQFMERFVYQAKYYKLQISLLEALASTIFGDIKKSNQILHSISLKCKSNRMDTDLLAEWNLINVINRVFSDEKDGLKADLFELATFTNNINEQFTKNIIKLILGYILKEEGNKAKALEIFNDQITYFAKEKVAIGALLSWLLIIQMKMDDNDDTALSTALKSLEIAQSPKINNFIFTIYFQKCLAEIYLGKQDYNSVKMYLEQAIVLAKQQDLKYQLVELYITYGDFMQEFMKSSNDYTETNVNMIVEMYENANIIARELDIECLIEKTQRYQNEFKVFRQLKSI